MAPSVAGSEQRMPPSPTLSARTTATTLGVASSRLPGLLVNRADLRNSLDAYETLLNASKGYTQALLALSTSSSEIACALETCSRLKDTWWKETAIPLLEHHDMYVQACTERSIAHEKAIVQKSKELNEAEKRNRKESKSKIGRDLVSFRKALNELQRRVDELDEEKIRYYSDVLEGEEECWDFIQGKLMKSLRSQLDVYERISSKGLSDAILEPLLSSIPDPFSAYGPPRNDEQIFSILGPNHLTSVSPSPNADSQGTLSAQSGPSSNGVINQFIMSPSTPAKGLSRVTSGAASPVPGDEEAGPSSNGLGISLTSAVLLAQEKERADKTGMAGSADLFGTDGEDDGGDEASIFSGTEDEARSVKVGQVASGNNSSGEGAPSSTAEKLIKDRKKRRERSKAGAKNRLKHSLSIIDESKGPAGTTTTNSSALRNALEARDTNVTGGDDNTHGADTDKTGTTDSSDKPTWW